MLVFSASMLSMLGSTRLLCFYYVKRIIFFADHLNLTMQEGNYIFVLKVERLL